MTWKPKARVPKQAAVQASDTVSDKDPRPHFLMYYAPDDWQVMPDGELWPSISHVSTAVGSGANPRDPSDIGQIKVDRDRNGQVLIREDVLGPGTSYVAEYTGRAGQDVCRSVFMRPVGGPTKTKWQPNVEAYRKFLQVLRKRGDIAPPKPHVIEGLIASVASKRQFASDNRPSDGRAMDVWERRMTMYDRQLSALTQELEASRRIYDTIPEEVDTLLSALLDGEAPAGQREEPKEPQVGLKPQAAGKAK